MKPVILCVSDIDEDGFTLVGGKSYGIKKLHDLGIPIPQSLVITTDFFKEVLKSNNLGVTKFHDFPNRSAWIRRQMDVRKIKLSDSQKIVLNDIYKSFQGKTIAVRSSCVYEDLDNASFSGQYDSYINISTFTQFKKAVIDCYAGTYSERVWDYLITHKIKPKKIAMALLVQETINASASGVIFTTHPQSASDDILYIEANFGFGETVVGNQTGVDSFLIHKSGLNIIGQTLGNKKFGVRKSPKGGLKRFKIKNNEFCLTPPQVIELSRLAVLISQSLGHAQDIEFALDESRKIIILQTRNQLLSSNNYLISYSVNTDQTPPVTGSLGISGAAFGKLVLAQNYRKGNIVITDKLDVYDIPRLRQASALVVKKFSLGSHAASILRELKIPTLIEPKGDIAQLLNQVCTIDCSCQPPAIYKGKLPLKIEKIHIKEIPRPNTKIFVGCSHAPTLYNLRSIPIEGIGLVRSEFIINSEIGIHPFALVDYDRRQLNPKTTKQIKNLLGNFKTGQDFFITKLSQNLAQILSLLPGKIVNFRLCDLQTDSFMGMVGGNLYEQVEDNPAMGFRGTTRLISESYQPALALELQAIQRVWNMGFTGLRIMLPFCRLPEDVAILISKIRQFGLTDIKIGMMVELASNIFLAKDFALLMDYFFIGPRDLTQSIYGADRTLPQLSKYNLGTAAPKEAVMTLLRNINGMNKEVFIALFDLYKHLADYNTVKSNNTLYYSGSPSDIVNDFYKISQLEKI